MTKKPRISKEERDLFRSAVSGVTPLKQKRSPVVVPPPEKSAPFIPRAEREPDIAQVDEDPSIEPVHSEDYLSFARSGLQHRVKQRLRRGEMAIGALLDLHGLTVAKAKQALEQFLAQSQRLGLHCVCVIHGKAARIEDNRPILKNKVNQWLQSYPGVLAFCSAKPAHGGVGAVYVLLKSIA